MEAFMAAVNDGQDGHGAKKSSKKEKETQSPEDVVRSLSQVQGIVTREVTAASNDSPSAGHAR
jgi:hypothetical protein